MFKTASLLAVDNLRDRDATNDKAGIASGLETIFLYEKGGVGAFAGLVIGLADLKSEMADGVTERKRANFDVVTFGYLIISVGAEKRTKSDVVDVESN